MRRCWTALFFFAFQAGAQVADGISLEQMRRDLVKLDRSIMETKDKIKLVKDARFLPDLYFALSEFLVDKSRYMYAVKVAENPKTPPDELDFTAEKRPKLEAIQVYETIIEKFPKLEERDKAVFYRAHELRELGRTEDMLKAYQQLSVEYPNSVYWTESQIIIGDYLFEEKKDMDAAMIVYQKILQRPPGPFTPLANYKIGWVHVNKSQFGDAVLAYERVLIQNQDVDLAKLPAAYRKTDVRREALIALVWPLSELDPKKLVGLASRQRNLLEYFYTLAPDKMSYEKVLARLGKRLELKKRHVEATKVYFELLRITLDMKDRLDASERLYVSMKNTQKNWPVRGLVQETAKTLTLVEGSHALSDAERKKALFNLEIFARDVATRQNKRAKQTRAKEDWDWTIRDYNLYLSLFPQSKYFRAIKLNLAESYFNAGYPVEAGREYEWLAKHSKGGKKEKTYYDSTLQSYIAAIRQQSSLSRLQLTEARHGLREAGRSFMATYPTDRANSDILFNIGQTFYDERRFPQAVTAFKEYLSKYPGGPKASVSANLILDAHNQREDYKAIITDGRGFLNNPKIKDLTLRRQVREIVQQAEMRAVQVAAGDFSTPDYAANLLKLARKYKGSSLGDQALYEAFTALKAKKDPKAYDSGEQLLMQHRASKYALEVTTVMGQMALASADFRRAALYFEIFNDRYGNRPEAKEFLSNAAKMRELMGDYKIAANDYKKLGDNLSAARMDFLSRDWSALLRSAPSAGGIYASYYEGLAQYRLRGIGQARAALERASQMGNDFTEQEMAAHSLYLLSMAAMENYKAIQMSEGAEAKAVNDKAARLKALEAQLNRVIHFGNGRWTIAALYSLGQTNTEFARFIRSAPTPKNLSSQQMAQYRKILEQQASQYENNAKRHFQQCLGSAEKFEVLTRFTAGCQSAGKIEVDEAKEVMISARAADSTPPASVALRRQLLDQPRNTALFLQLANIHIKAKDYAMTELILNRALEIEPNSAALMADVGVINLYKRDYVSAKAWFEKALAKDPKNALALRGMAGLFRQFRFPTKYQQYATKAKAAGPAKGLTHPMVLGAD
ncbi:MAG: tetratricopeptide repeat protein [Bdellovibrionales bacterium]